MRRLPATVFGIAMMLCNTAIADATSEFRALIDNAWEQSLDRDPVWASMRGDRRGNSRWSDISEAAVEQHYQDDRDLLAALRAINADELSEDDQLNYELFRRELQNRLDANKYQGHLLPVNQQGGVQSLDAIAERIPLRTLQDFEDWLTRMAAIDDVIAQTTALMESGRKKGYMPPAVLMERVTGQIAAQLVENAEDSPFYNAFRNLPDTISGDDADQLRQRARDTIDDDIVPAYQRFASYFERTYLPASRDSIGASTLPNGDAYYEFLARQYTTTQLTPDEIHRIGLDEVARIRDEMQQIIAELEFDGSFAEFLQFLRTDPQFYFDDPQELFDAYLVICKRIDPQLVDLFGVLPRTPYGLRPIPAHIAPDTTTAFYSPPAADGTRAGFYYVNLYQPEQRPKYEMEVLSVHEAMPGHHLQIALQMELTDLPDFRRNGGFTAFIEGWGLYSERLGHDLGLYQDPYSHFGALTYDMWRAVRLVVDTGIHYKGWTRQQAIDFFKDNAAKSELDIVNEIDRYIAWPGQALAYKIGQLKILEIRQKAEQALGQSFDIRAFHDALLGGGALPLDILDIRMNRWLADQLRQKANEMRLAEG